jgi:hypothetical protein
MKMCSIGCANHERSTDSNDGHSAKGTAAASRTTSAGTLLVRERDPDRPATIVEYAIVRANLAGRHAVDIDAE